MSETIITIWYFIVFIPGIYLFYLLLQCFNFEKLIFNGKAKEYKILIIFLSIILSFLFAFAFSETISRLYNFFQ